MEMKVLIFVVDDEELIQEFLKDTLEDAGFAVSAATSGEETIKMLDTQGERFRALVTDVESGDVINGMGRSQTRAEIE